MDAETLLFIITNVGDAGLLLPASLAVVLALWFGDDRQTAIAFAVALGLSVGLTIAAKLAFMTCSATEDIHSPSGHASLATAFFLSLALIGARSSHRVPGVLFALACVLAVIFIAVSRVYLEAHTSAETVAGVAIGLASLSAFWKSAAPHPNKFALLILVILLPLGVAYAVSGAHIGIEPFLERLSAWISKRWAC